MKCDKNIKENSSVTVQFTGNVENVKNTKIQFKPPKTKTEFCPICDLPFVNKVLLQNHMKIVHRQKLNDPELIDDSEGSDVLIDRSGKKVEIPKVVSATRIMSYYTKRVIQEGFMPTYTTRNEYSCNKCKEEFDSLPKVKTHYETKCKKGVKTWAITMQEAGYGKKINPDSIIPETRKSPRKMSEKQKSDDKVNLEVSKNFVKQKISEGKAIEFQCNYCDKYFTSKSILWTHLNEQHNIDKSLKEVSTSDDEDIDKTVDNSPSKKLLFQEKPAVIKFANRAKLQTSPSKKTSSIFKCQVPPAKNSPKKPKPSTSSTVNCQLSTTEPKQFRVQFKCTKCQFSTYEVEKLTEHTKNVHVQFNEKICGVHEEKPQMQIKLSAQESYRKSLKKKKASVQNIDDKRKAQDIFKESIGKESENVEKPFRRSYASLITEALDNAPNGALSIADIYKAINARHPEYSLIRCSGWQNSIRHNLSLHKNFIREGKYWKLAYPDNSISTSKVQNSIKQDLNIGVKHNEVGENSLVDKVITNVKTYNVSTTPKILKIIPMEKFPKKDKTTSIFKCQIPPKKIPKPL